jgi:ectoine hydroxylase-related dioxygenase (phytanoyl-CoA dioxygenase family)
MSASGLVDSAAVLHFQQQGYLALRQFFTSEQAAAVRHAYMTQAAQGPVLGLSEIDESFATEDPLRRWPRMILPHQRIDLSVGALTLRYMLEPRLGQVLEQLMGEEALAVQSMFYFKPPGSRGQALHQDNFYLRVTPGTCVAAWIAVDDADRENGGLVVVPGSGNMELVCPEKADASTFFTKEQIILPPGLAEQPIDLRAGDVLLFNGSLIHGSYPNTSADRFRRAMIFHYVPRSTAAMTHWYRQPLAFDGKTIKLGEASGGGPCGNVGDEAPAGLLRRTRAAVGRWGRKALPFSMRSKVHDKTRYFYPSKIG